MSINEQIAAYSWLQALGTNIQAVGQTKLLSKKKRLQKEGKDLVILGNILQAVANAAQTFLTLEQRGSTGKERTLNSANAFGSFLQSVGNSIQALTTDGS
ncbi:DUF6944 family repetitive protein [Paenibacillus yonginensis]|nr:hypothetical protein [Paenibacillus yonginensis]